MNANVNGIEALLLLELQELDTIFRRAGIDPVAPKAPTQYEFGQIAEKWPILHEDLEAERDFTLPYTIIRGNMNRLWEKSEEILERKSL